MLWERMPGLCRGRAWTRCSLRRFTASSSAASGCVSGASGGSIKVTQFSFSSASAASRQKSLLILRPAALVRLKQLYAQRMADEGSARKYLKISVQSKGCSGSSYSLSFVPSAAPLDEAVEQDGVKVLVDGKALLSVIGSEVDFVQEPLSSQFVFYNPNVKETCGCGLSFTTTGDNSTKKGPMDPKPPAET